jgi:membrane protease YdiL (CAAX protease family)
MKKVWIAIGIIVALTAIYYAAQAIVSFIIGIIAAFPIIGEILSAGNLDLTQMLEETARAVIPLVPLILLCAVAVTVPLYYLIYRNRKQELLAFISVRSIGAVSIPVLIIFGISMNFIVEWLLSLVGGLELFAPVFEKYGELTQYITGGNFILSLLAVGIVAPVFEEILFRGLIFGELRKVTQVRAALFIQAVLFGVYHLDIIQGSYAFLIGILLGYVYYRSNSILAPIIVHAAVNTTSIILSRVAGGELDAWTAAIIAASFILFAATGVFILTARSFKRTMNNSLYDMFHTQRLEE